MFGIPSEGFQNKKSNIFVDDKDTNDWINGHLDS
jgi:hypothetical protein